MPTPVLIFDLDGTLVDSAPDLTHALNFTLAGAGLRTVELADVRRMVGMGARRLIEQGMEQNGAEKPPEEIDGLLETFLDYYGRNLCVDTALFPGVAETLDSLKGRYRMGICTNKPEGLSRRLVAELGYADYFPVILGGDSLAYRKPDPRHIQATRDQLDAFSPGIMIGDSMADVAGARSAGMPVIAVSFGYSAVPAHDFNADVLVDHFHDIPDAIEQIIRSGSLDR